MREEDWGLDQDRVQVDLEYEAEQTRVRDESRRAFAQQASQEAGRATIAAIRDMFTSLPLPGVQSPFYAGDRYYADPEQARRARRDLEELQALEASLTAAGDAAAARMDLRVA